MPDFRVKARAHLGNRRQPQQTRGGGHVTVRGQRVPQHVIGEHLDALREEQLSVREAEAMVVVVVVVDLKYKCFESMFKQVERMKRCSEKHSVAEPNLVDDRVRVGRIHDHCGRGCGCRGRK